MKFHRYTKFMAIIVFTSFPLLTYAAPPKGWFLAGSSPSSYESGVDQSIRHSGKASGYLKSKAKKIDGFGTLMQMIVSQKFLGKRVRLTAWVKAKEVASWAGLWMRVDGKGKKMLAFDNMQNRPIKGTKDWTQYQIVLDVAKDAQEIAFGILLHGTGRVWLDDLKMHTVKKHVPTTGHNVPANKPDLPQNTSFEQ